MRTLAPILEWLPAYRRAWLARDLVAGAAAWAVLVPLGLAYSGVVGVDPVIGLYTIPLPLVAYAVFGGSRLFVVGPDAAVVVLASATLTAVAAEGDRLSLVFPLTLLVGALYLAFFLLRFGWIADVIPDPVLKGFVEGAIWITVLTQIPALLGLEVDLASRGFVGKFAAIARALPDAHGPTTILAVSSMAALWLLRRFARRLPGPLVVLAASIVVVRLLGLDRAGVAVVGEAGAHSPGLFRLTGLDLDRIADLVPGALAIVVLGYTKSLGALKRAHEADPTEEPMDPDRELLALGAANVAAGSSGGYAVAGSFSATAMRIAAGGRTQVASLFAALLGVLTVLFLLGPVAYIPLAAMAAIVVVAMAGLSDFGYLRRLWGLRRFEVAVALAAFAGVLAFDIMAGVAIGLVLALFKLAHAIHDPVVAAVGRSPSGAFIDLDQQGPAAEIPGMLILRCYAPIVFLNARVLTSRIKGLALAREGLRVVVVDATASSGIDSTAADAFRVARSELAAAGITLWIVNAREAGWRLVAASLEAAGVPVPPRFESLGEAVARFERSGAADQTPPISASRVP
ncbi:MAG: SulP family inorganic anion transporter [Acidobacteria bacterium]|jgi:high affinity sulfate transporter 1|nr:SulP family inorganic anion transporter [Acidobacteriota bacterium]